MKVVFLLAFRNLASRQSRALLTILGIAIGIATAVAVFILDYNTLLTMKFREIMIYGTPDIEITPTVSDSKSIARARTLFDQKPNIIQSTPLFFKNLFLTLPGGHVGMEIAGVEPEARDWFGGYSIRRGGRDISRDGGLSILLNEKFCQANEIAVGDTVRFLERPDLPFQVTGLLRNWKLGSRNNGNSGIIPFQAGRQVFESQSIVPFFWAKTDNSLSFDGIRADLGYEYLVTRPPHVLVGETGDKKVMRDGVRLSGLLTLCLGLYLVFTSLSMAVAERIREIGLMQAIGTTDMQVTAVFIIEAGMMAAVGTVCGLIGGLGLALALSKLGFSSIGTGLLIWTAYIPYQRIGLILLLGIGAAMVGALYPLLKAKRISVVEALKQRGMVLEVVLSRRLYALLIAAFALLVPAGYAAVGMLLELPWREAFPLIAGTVWLLAGFLSVIFLAPSMVAILIRLVSWPMSGFLLFEGFLVKRTLARATDRIAASLMTLAIVFAGVIGLKHMTMSLKMQSQSWVQSALTNRIFVGTRLLTRAEYTEFNKVPGVRQIVPMSFTAPTPFLIRGIPAETMQYGPLLDDPALLEKFTSPHTMMISSQLSYTLGLSEGDDITIQTEDGPTPFKIMMVTDAYGYFLDERSYGVTSLDNLLSCAPVDTSASRSFTLVLEEGANQVSVKNALYGHIGQLGMHITTGEDKSFYTLQGIDRDFIIFEIILIITAVLAGIGVTNALLIGALERKREFGLLQALGVTPEQLRRIVVLEGTVIGTIGGLLGALLGIPLSSIIIDGLILLSGLDLSLTLSPEWIGISIFTAILVSTLAALYPAIRSVRISVTESLQYE